jgi:hypothetical protein
MNVTFENATLIGGDYEGNFTNFTTLTPTIPSDNSNMNGLIVGSSIMICVGLAATCFMMIPFIVECIKDYNVNESRSCRKSCYCLFCCSSNHQLSDIERNNRYNSQIMTENTRHKKDIEIVQLVEIVVADPFDATETCSICLGELGEGDNLGALPCGHKHFHKKCIDDWMRISNNKSCPICRNMVV